MSEFYMQRRTSIKDTVAFVAFLFGWFAAAPFGWPYIAAGFDGGNPAAGVLRFLFVVFGAGIAFGAAGLLLGTLAGGGWEAWHRRARRAAPPAVEVPSLVKTDVQRSTVPRLPLPLLRYETSNLDPADYVDLVRRAGSDDHDVARIGSALARSTTIGAWDGDVLVGAVRILSDGYVAASLADIVVDPGYQRRGLGRELMSRAFDLTPRGTLHVVARPGTGAFFDAIGCDRALAGFCMRRTARRDTSPT